MSDCYSSEVVNAFHEDDYEPYANGYPEGSYIVLSDWHGQYIPREFAQSVFACSDTLAPDLISDLECCARGPYWEEEVVKPGLSKFDQWLNNLRDYLKDGQWLQSDDNYTSRLVHNEWYWEAWQNILNNYKWTEIIKNTRVEQTFSLHQDGDLWAIPDQEWEY